MFFLSKEALMTHSLTATRSDKELTSELTNQRAASLLAHLVELTQEFVPSIKNAGFVTFFRR